MSEKRYDYLLLGNSTAAIAALEAIRESDAQGSIAIVSEQPNHTYCSPLITYVLGGKVPQERINYRPLDFYEALRVDTYLGVECTEVRPAEHQVTLASGLVLGYEKLLIAVGGSPIIPDIPGVDLEGVFTFTRHEDMCRVREFIKRRRVSGAVVVGGGMIGIKVAEAMVSLGIETTIVELADRVLGQALDEGGSQMARRALEEHGIRVITGAAATSVGGADGHVQSVTLESGSRIPAEIVIM